MRSMMRCWRAICASCHWGVGAPSSPLMLPMRIHGRWAGPVKSTPISSSVSPIRRHTRARMASPAIGASGMSKPWRAIQSISRSHSSQPQKGEV